METFLGYKVSNGVVVGAPCGCYAAAWCGHPGCQTPPNNMLLAERLGLVVRCRVGGAWVWLLTHPR